METLRALSNFSRHKVIIYYLNFGYYNLKQKQWEFLLYSFLILQESNNFVIVVMVPTKLLDYVMTIVKKF